MRSEDGAVGNILPDEFESGQRLQLAQAMLFHAHVIDVVQVVHADDSMALLDQHFGDTRADESGCAGNQVISHLSCDPFQPNRAECVGVLLYRFVVWHDLFQEWFIEVTDEGQGHGYLELLVETQKSL